MASSECNVAIVGAGLIGRAWAAIFARAGWNVRLTDPHIPTLKADNVPMQIFLTVFIVPLIAVIEFAGSILRAAILAIRLFANLFAGHVALGVILAFALGANGALNVGGGVAAVLMGTALSCLELFVAFLQAFVFVLLTSIFLGMQLNPEH